MNKAHFEQRIDDLEQALAAILGAVRYADHDHAQALETIGRVATEALDGARRRCLAVNCAALSAAISRMENDG